jgi:hypothetical protein
MDWLYRLTGSFRSRQWNKSKFRDVQHIPWKGWGAAKRVGILFDAYSFREDLEPLRALVAHWKLEQRAVSICGWTGQMRPKNVLYNGRQLVFIDDFTWKGQPESGNALEFIQTEFDLLICLHRSSGSPLDDLAAKTRAGLRVCAAGEQDFYDLCLIPDSNDYIAYGKDLSEWLIKITPTPIEIIDEPI